VVFPFGQRFHALWGADVGLKLAFSGAKSASDASRTCASSYEIRSKEVIENNKCRISHQLLTALTGALLRCSFLVWLATRRSQRLALHPATTPKKEHRLFPHPLPSLLSSL
jgi:hypothetical protein